MSSRIQPINSSIGLISATLFVSLWVALCPTGIRTKESAPPSEVTHLRQALKTIGSGQMFRQRR